MFLGGYYPAELRICGTSDSMILCNLGYIYSNNGYNKVIEVPTGVTYTLGDTYMVTVSGQQFMCTTSSFTNNVMRYKYVITRTYTDVYEISNQKYVGRVNKGLANFVGFEFSGNSDCIVGVADIHITVE